jgi:SAM-dependent methyltransferase
VAEIPVEFRERGKAVWKAGDWDEVADLIAAVGPKLLDEVGIEQGMDVLDVGTGSGGSIAIPAAERGARVVGADLVSEHFDDGRRRAQDAGVEVEWVETGADSMPFEDASFDRVLSTFGHMFAPDHAATAAEMARVCRPGGIVATATWLPESFASELLRSMGAHLPPPPEGVQSPGLWGEEQHVRDMFEPEGLELEFKRDTMDFIHDTSPDGFATLYEQNLGPVVTAKAVLGDRWEQARADLVAIFERHNGGGPDSIRMPAGYLVSIARKPG